MTFQLDIDVTISRSIEAVFDRLVDIDAYDQWLPREGLFFSTRTGTTGAARLGTTYTDRTRVGTFRGEIIALERPARVVFRHRLHWLGIPVMETRPGYELAAVDGGTRLHHHAEGELFGVFKLMRPRAVHLARKERQRTVDALKRSFDDSLSQG